MLEAKAILEAIGEVLAEHEQVFSAWGEAYCHCPSIYNELLRMSECLPTLGLPLLQKLPFNRGQFETLSDPVQIDLPTSECFSASFCLASLKNAKVLVVIDGLSSVSLRSKYL